MNVPIFIPLLRDSFRAEDSFRDWGHQALIPFVGGSIIEFILKDIAYASEQIKVKTNVVMISKEEKKKKFEKVKEKTLSALKAMDLSFSKMEVRTRTRYRYLQDIVRVLVNVIEDYKSAYPDEKGTYVVHYPAVVLQNEVYMEFFKSLKSLDTSEPSILLVVFPVGNEKEDKDVLFRGDITVRDIIPRTNIQPSPKLVVKKGTKKDYIAFEHKGDIYTAEIVGVFAFNESFLKMLKEGYNINLTSENRLQDVMKYLCATHNVKVSVIAISSGRFVSLKYPWQILKGFDFVSRFLLYRMVKNEGTNYVKLILNESSNESWRGVVVTEKTAGMIKFENIEKLERDKNLERPKYRYAFEDYPLENETDPIEEYLFENGYSGVVFLKSSRKEKATEILKNIVEDPNTVLLRGIIFMETESSESKTKISAGAHVRSSYIGAGSKVLGQAILDHSIIGKNTIMYPNSVVPYAILGNNVVIGGQVTFAREKARNIGGVLKRPPVFYTGKEIIRYETRFSTLVGDGTKIMMGVDVSPGCRIGYGCEVFPNISVIYNIPPHTRVRYDGTFERRREGS